MFVSTYRTAVSVDIGTTSVLSIDQSPLNPLLMATGQLIHCESSSVFVVFDLIDAALAALKDLVAPLNLYKIDETSEHHQQCGLTAAVETHSYSSCGSENR